MTLNSETLKQALNQEINLHETPMGKGGLRGSSGRSDEWEKGFCQAMRHIRDSVLPPMERQEKTDPECWQNENGQAPQPQCVSNSDYATAGSHNAIREPKE